MITIKDWSDLSRFGINCLTGESCNLGLRLLCDLTQDAAIHYLQIIGCIKESVLRFPKTWNYTTLNVYNRKYNEDSKYDEVDTVYSANIPRDLFGTLAVMLPILHLDNCLAVVKNEDRESFHAIMLGDVEENSRECIDEFVRTYITRLPYCRTWMSPNAKVINNLHKATGRTI